MRRISLIFAALAVTALVLVLLLRTVPAQNVGTAARQINPVESARPAWRNDQILIKPRADVDIATFHTREGRRVFERIDFVGI